MSKRFWTGLVGGTLFGLLFAKKSGRVARDEIHSASKVGGWQGGLEQLAKELGELGEEFIGTVEHAPTVEKAVSKTKSAVNRAVSDGKKKARSVAKNTVKKLKKNIPGLDRF